jgi:hypothetical protein
MNILIIWSIIFVLCVPYKHRKDMLFAIGLKDFWFKGGFLGIFWGYFLPRPSDSIVSEDAGSFGIGSQMLYIIATR